MLYPFKFYPIPKQRIWGGHKLKHVLNKPFSDEPIGESWELSTVPGSVSIVENGRFAGKNLQDLINEFPIEVLGEKVYTKYGTDFPLLIKFIDAQTDLSIQLHPDDTLAKKRHNSLGKEEVWYIMQAETDSNLMFGFSKELDKQEYQKYLDKHSLESILHYEKVREGDVYHIPTGRVHAIGGGILLAEIQQSSDVTYRLYDWNRVDNKGNSRELHTDLALDAIDFSVPKSFKTHYQSCPDDVNLLVRSNYFTTNLLDISKEYIPNTRQDTFIIYIVVEGNGMLESNGFKADVKTGDVFLIPACLEKHSITPLSKKVKLLQVFP